MPSRSPHPLIIPPINDQEPNPRSFTSPTSISRRPNKRKRVGSKKQKAIEETVQTLIENLKPIPFKPSKTINFTKHEKFLKRLGLWDFVHIEFDREIRVDLIAELIANYESRASYVHGFRIAVNRADLGCAFKLPVKKDKGSALASSSDTLHLDSETVANEESIGFIEDFMSNWLLLHEDTWILPDEVVNCMKAIKDGHPEKVDWTGLVWFMVEKELNLGNQLKECYYASHLQYLIRSQRDEFFHEQNTVVVGAAVKEEKDGGDVEMRQEIKGAAEVEMKEEESFGEAKIVQEAEVETIVEVKDEGGGEIKTGKEPEVEASVEVVEEEEDDGKVKMGKEHMVESGVEMKEEGEDGGKLKLGIEPMLEVGIEEKVDGGKLKMGMESMLEVGIEEKVDGGKLEIGPEDDMLHKRLRTDHKSSYFECMRQVQQWMERVTMVYEAKKHAFNESNMNQQVLLSQLQCRDNMIGHLHKTKDEEMQKKDGEIYRLERELYFMDSLLEGYRKSVKETQKALSEYRQQRKLPEEPVYKDAGPGGLVLSTMELEKRRMKREAEDRMIRIVIEQKMKEFEVLGEKLMRILTIFKSWISG